jgi:Phytanoyl-CoA dioxygenase (PhyH)
MTTDHNGFRHLSELVVDIDNAVRRLGLQDHIYELEVQGYTVVENALGAVQRERLSGALLAAAAADDGAPIELDGRRHRDRTQEVFLLLARGVRAVEELVLHPTTLTLITYLLGASATLSSVSGYVKGPGDTALGVHSDTAYVPDPLPPYAQLANVNYCLTDYSEAHGCLTVVPGSHRYGHRARCQHQLVPPSSFTAIPGTAHGHGRLTASG